ncbi:MAG: GYD domain-containing protein [Pseudomonadota bacterium]
MPTFITQGRYSEAAIKGMTAKPDDRKQAVAALVEAAGGELLDYYVTLGDYDFLAISTAPDEQALLKVLITAGATGGVTGLTTTMAFSTAEFADAAAGARKLIEGFRPAGSH